MAWLVPLLPVFGALLLGLTGLARGDGRGGRAPLAVLSTGTMVATAALAGLAGVHGWTGRLLWAADLGLSLDYAYGTSPVVPIFAVLVPLVAAPVVAYAAYHEEARGLRRLLVLLTFFAGAMELVAGAADLLTLVVGWEVIGACSALLVAHGWWERGKARAGAVVFLTTRAGDLGMFLAVVAAFAGAGSLRYGALPGLTGLPLHLVAAGLLAAAAAKSAQLPFAPWLFAAMEGPVTVSTLLHAATMVAAGAFLLIRLEPVLGGVAWFGPAAMAVGVTTALAGGLVALLQPHAKRLLAGSTSAHYGLMFVAVGAGYPAVAVLHLVAHALAKAPLFLASGVAHGCTGSYRLPGMKLGRALPGVAIASALPAAALAGVPPLGAAWTKEEVVTAAGHASPWLAVAVSIAGGLSAAYMARFWFQAFGRGGAGCGEGESGRPPRTAERGALYLLAAATALLSLLWAAPVAQRVAEALAGIVPSSEAWELAASLLLVTVGVAIGWAVARFRPRLGEAGAAPAADWLGLPALARLVIARPAQRCADLLARFDDGVLDRAVWLLPGVARDSARLLARFDDAVVDGTVWWAADAAARLAVAGKRGAEVLIDGAPEGLSRLVGRAGSWARRLQTGLAHQYYRLIMVGLGILLVLLILGG